jgi:hypothetical protein
MEAFPKLLFVVVILTFAILFSSYYSCLFFGFPPIYITEHIQKYNSIERNYKITFSMATHPS